MVEFFLEIGCEEIPAKMIPHSLKEGQNILKKLLDGYNIHLSDIASYATPTRLIYHIEQIDLREADQTVTVQGPPKRICYGNDGTPSKALQGFMIKNGVSESDVRFEQGKTGEIAVADVFVKGEETTNILSAAIPVLLKKIPFRKNMRWADRDIRFVRPIRWICALLDGKTVNFEYAGVQAGNVTRGHRILGRRDIPVESFSDYRDKLKANHVLIDPKERKELISDAIASFEKTYGASIIQDEALLDEVTYLVETPLVVEGTFDEKFLAIPEEVLITSMKEHQKYFASRGTDDALLPRFLTVASASADPEGFIKVGNERVLAARLYDAQFFWDEDRKKPLESRMEKLERQIFQTDLGTYAEKIARMKQIGLVLGALVHSDPNSVEHTIDLCKCDLATDMVYEFPELQGIMGGLYAKEEGKTEGIWKGIYDHYRPGSMDDQLPRTREGELTALSDKLDTFLGCLAVGIVPTGSKDPFGLRRAAQSMVRIVLEKELDFDFYAAIDDVLPIYDHVLNIDRKEWHNQMMTILDARVRFWFETRGYTYDEIDAVLGVPHGNLIDTMNRISALKHTRGDDNFLRVATSFKRINNILDAASDTIPETVIVDRFAQAEETALFEAMQSLDAAVSRHTADKDYESALKTVGQIAGAVDRFFDAVLVMDKDDATRQNRLALLNMLRNIFLSIADFSRLVISE